jgi:hypothetical protein
MQAYRTAAQARNNEKAHACATPLVLQGSLRSNPGFPAGTAVTQPTAPPRPPHPTPSYIKTNVKYSSYEGMFWTASSEWRPSGEHP